MNCKYSTEVGILQLLFLKAYGKQPDNSSATEGMFVTFSVHTEQAYAVWS